MASTNKDSEKKKVKVKITKNRMITVFVIVAAVVAAYIYVWYVPKPVYSVDYKGVILNFRADLREADKVSVQPGPDQVFTELINPLVKNITIVYNLTNDPDQDKYYSLAAFEISEKLKLGMLVRSMSDIGIDAKPFSDFNLTTYENLPGKIQHPLIVVILPAYANQTRVFVSTDHIIFIEAVSYKDFDLAIDKFLMSALRIQV